MAIAIVLIIILILSVLFNAFSPWWFTPLASNWGTIDDTVIITMWVTGIVFILVTVFMIYAIIRYRHREGHSAHYEPESKKLEWTLIGLTSIGIIAMLAPGLIVYDDFVHVPDDAYEIDVLAQQWQWRFRFPGEDGKLGTSDVSHMSTDNPFGINPADPNGQDDVLISSNELHLPIDKPVKALLRSKDVLHDFYVPNFRAKMDIVPGLVSYFWMTPTKIGKYDILCAEYCGIAHYNMRGYVYVDSEEDFNTWLASNPTFAQSQNKAAAPADGDPIQRGLQISQQQGCLACHSVDGSAGVGPTWKGLFGKTEALVDGSSVTADADYLKESITAANAKVVAGYPPAMPSYNLSEADLDAVVAYIESLQ